MAESKRQLLAIMFTDIVGYSAMMNDDEARTVDILKRNLEIHTRITEAHRGKVRKEIGDVERILKAMIKSLDNKHLNPFSRFIAKQSAVQQQSMHHFLLHWPHRCSRHVPL